ncbi:MAG: prolyl oligopeptidase family serine peptidase [Pseudomonadota bacterium]
MSGPTLEVLDGAGPVYGPPDGENLAGMVFLHGSEGPMAGWGHRFCVIMAMHGILALPWAYGDGDYWAAGKIENVDIRGVLDAAERLARHPRCRGVGLFGASKGGELALLAAALSGSAAPFSYVAAHAPSAVIREAFDPARMRSEGWGAPIRADGPRAWVWPGRDAQLTPGTPIEIERYGGPVFLSVGDQDDIAPPDAVLSLARRLDAAGNPPDLFLAPGQGHAFDFDTEPQLWARLTSFIERAL